MVMVGQGWGGNGGTHYKCYFGEDIDILEPKLVYPLQILITHHKHYSNDLANFPTNVDTDKFLGGGRCQEMVPVRSSPHNLTQVQSGHHLTL